MKAERENEARWWSGRVEMLLVRWELAIRKGCVVVRRGGMGRVESERKRGENWVKRRILEE